MTPVERAREQIAARGTGSRRSENLSEEAARIRKAQKLADCLGPMLEKLREDRGIDDAPSLLAEGLQPSVWKLAAECAGTREPSDKSISLVIYMLRERERSAEATERAFKRAGADEGASR